MYLLDNQFEVIEQPWKHIVVNDVLPPDVAKYMLENFPQPGNSEKEQRQNKYLGCPEDPVFKEFWAANMKKEKDFHSTLNKVFGHDEDLLENGRLSFKCSVPRQSYEVLKKWHTDASDKRYKILIYLGSGDGGWLELGNPITRETKRYDYAHNRAVIYDNSSVAFHRFYSADVNRYTIGFSVKFSDPTKTNYDESAYNHLQMVDEL